VPEGFIGGALINRLYRQGLSPEVGGIFMAVVMLPWVFKLVWAPLVDNVDLLNTQLGGRLSWFLKRKRFAWIVCSTLVMMLSLVSLAVFDGWIAGVMVVAVVHNVARSFQDVATDGLAIKILDEKERGFGQSAMWAAHMLGGIAAGSGVIYFSDSLPWAWFCGLVIGFIVVTGLLLPWMMMPVPSKEELATEKTSWRDLYRSFLSLTAVCLVLVCLLAHVAEGLTAPIIEAWLQRDLGYDNEWIGTIDFYSRWGKFVAMILGGFVARWIAHRRALAFAVVLKVAVYLSLGAFAGYWGSKGLVLGLVILSGLVDGVFLILLCTLLMDHTWSRVAATQFAVFMAFKNLSVTWTVAAGGVLSTTLSSADMFLMGGACQLLLLLPLFFVRSGKERT